MRLWLLGITSDSPRPFQALKKTACTDEMLQPRLVYAVLQSPNDQGAAAKRNT